MRPSLVRKLYLLVHNTRCLDPVPNHFSTLLVMLPHSSLNLAEAA